MSKPRKVSRALLTGAGQLAFGGAYCARASRKQRSNFGFCIFVSNSSKYKTYKGGAVLHGSVSPVPAFSLASDGLEEIEEGERHGTGPLPVSLEHYAGQRKS